MPKAAIDEDGEFEFREGEAGLPNSGQLRRQPVMRCARMIAINRSSVSRLERDRANDITAERFRFEKTSVISGQGIGTCD